MSPTAHPMSRRERVVEAAAKVVWRSDFTARSSHPSGWLVISQPDTTETVWETMREREREGAHGGCVLRQGISVSLLASGRFPARTMCSHPFLSPPSLHPQPPVDPPPPTPPPLFCVFMSHLRTGLSWRRFKSHFSFLCFLFRLHLFCGT